MSELTVGEYAELWLREVSARNKATTVERYRQTYARHVAEAFGDRKIDSVTRVELKQFLAAKIEGGLHPKMLTTILSSLFSNALEDGFVEVNPAFGLGRFFHTNRRNDDIKAFTEDELRRFLRAAAYEPLYCGLFRAMAYAGLRLGEARALRCRDLVYRDEKLDVVRTFSTNTLSTTTKTHKARRIEIPSMLADELYQATRGFDPQDWIFDNCGDFLREKACRLGFRRIARRAKLPQHLQRSTHALRHTYATRLLERGASLPYLQRQLGHHSIKLTNDTYGRWAQLSDRNAINRFMADTDIQSLEELIEPASAEDDYTGSRQRRVLPFHRGRAPTLSVKKGKRTPSSRILRFPDADSGQDEA